MCVVPRTSLAMVSLGDLCGAGSKVVRESRVLAGARVRSTTRSWDAPLRVIARLWTGSCSRTQGPDTLFYTLFHTTHLANLS